MKSKQNIPVYVSEMAALNFRLFADFRMRFEPDLTVIVAPNAGGKTSVLEAMALVLRNFVHGNPKLITNNCRYTLVGPGDIKTPEKQSPNEIAVKIACDIKPFDL